MRKGPKNAPQRPQTDATAGDEAKQPSPLEAAVGALQALRAKHTELAEYHLSVATQLGRLLGG